MLRAIVSTRLQSRRACDLFSVEETARALAGAPAVAVAAAALIPPARLLQATRADAQLFAADTIARAATRAGVHEIALLGDDPHGELAFVLAHRQVRVRRAPESTRERRLAFAPSPRAVVSIQRMRVPADWTADRAAHEYLAFVPRFFAGVVRVRHEHASTVLVATTLPVPLLRLTEETPPDPEGERCVLRIAGGAFARGHGCLEFRIVHAAADRRVLLTAVHGFEPALPFSLYRRTQARVHAYVMHAYSRHLAFAALPGTTPAPRRFVSS